MKGGFSRRGLVVAGLALGLAGCATTPLLVAAAPDETFPELEPLLGARAEADGLIIRVTSKGCATKADFVFRVDRGSGHAVIAFARRRLETCKGPAGAAALRFAYDELGLTRADRFVVANAIVGDR